MNTNLIHLLPPHQTFVELLNGGAPMLLAKPRSKVEFLSDPAGDIANFFRVQRRPCGPSQLMRHVRFVGITGDESLDRAVAFSQSAQTVMGIRDRVGWVSLLRERLRGVQIDSRSHEDVVKRLDRPRTLFLVSHQIAGTFSEGLRDQLWRARGKIIICSRRPLPFAPSPDDWRTINFDGMPATTTDDAGVILVNFPQE